MAILNGQFNAVQILCQEGKAKTSLADKNGDSLLHYAAVTQGNANLYIRFLIEKQAMSVFIQNKKGQTPRQLAEQTDVAKFHRVIKTLKKYESLE
jgi:ankyrin repeat protein